MRRVDASNEAPAEACSGSHTTLALPDWTGDLALLVWHAFSLHVLPMVQVSFVNSICTVKGGTHVNHVVDQITKCASLGLAAVCCSTTEGCHMLPPEGL